MPAHGVLGDILDNVRQGAVITDGAGKYKGHIVFDAFIHDPAGNQTRFED